MDERGLIVPGGLADSPGGHFRAAMLLTAMTFIAAALPFLLTYPAPIHQVTIDLRENRRLAQAARPFHRLDIAADGHIMLDGRHRKDLVELRMGLDIIMLEREPGIDLRPDPELRYETFLEVLAVTRRASVPHLRVATVRGGRGQSQ